MTPPPDSIPEALEQVHRRQKLTQQTAQGTLDRIGHLESRVDGMAETVGETARDVARVEGKVDGMDGKVDLLTELVKKSLEAQSDIHVARYTAAVEVTRTADTAAVELKKTADLAAVEVRKTSEIAIIDEATDRRAARRQIAIKVVAIAGSVVAAVTAFLAGRC